MGRYQRYVFWHHSEKYVSYSNAVVSVPLCSVAACWKPDKESIIVLTVTA